MKVDKAKFGNMLVNVLAVIFLIAAVYAGVKFLIIPVSKYVWTASVHSLGEGYQQWITVAETYMQWDKALFLLLGLALYLVPAILAFIKKHPSRRSILVTNIVIGWSVIGWILALIWCYSAEAARRM